MLMDPDAEVRAALERLASDGSYGESEFLEDVLGAGSERVAEMVERHMKDRYGYPLPDLSSDIRREVCCGEGQD